jgi:nitronate monooxygenase
MRFAVGGRLFAKATVDGDVESGLLMMGQTVGRISDIPTVAEVIERTVSEAEEIIKSMQANVGS